MLDWLNNTYSSNIATYFVCSSNPGFEGDDGPKKPAPPPAHTVPTLSGRVEGRPRRDPEPYSMAGEGTGHKRYYTNKGFDEVEEKERKQVEGWQTAITYGCQIEVLELHFQSRLDHFQLQRPNNKAGKESLQSK